MWWDPRVQFYFNSVSLLLTLPLVGFTLRCIPLLMKVSSNFRLVSCWVHGQFSKELLGLVMTGQKWSHVPILEPIIEAKGRGYADGKNWNTVYKWRCPKSQRALRWMRGGWFSPRKLKVWLPEEGKGDSAQGSLAWGHCLITCVLDSSLLIF